jgi:hypothetical protein
MSAGPERIERIALGVVAALTVLGFALAVYDAPLFRVYTREDGVIENGTVLALLAGAVVCFRRVARLRGRRPALFLAATALLGVLYLAAAGEELSWGQHLFKFATPDFFQKHNAQREANVHNLVVQGVKLNRLIFGTGLFVAIVAYCSVAPPAYRRSPAVRRLVDTLAIPLPRTRQVVSYAVLAVVGALIPSQYRWEVVELISATVFLFITVDPVNRGIFDD